MREKESQLTLTHQGLQAELSFRHYAEVSEPMDMYH